MRERFTGFGNPIKAGFDLFLTPRRLEKVKVKLVFSY
jgi:hypothetical protein